MTRASSGRSDVGTVSGVPVADVATSSPAARPGISARWARSSWVTRALAAFAVSRALVYGVLVAVSAATGHRLTDLLQHWDGAPYLRIVRNGYPTDVYTPTHGFAYNEIAFFPGYPLLVRGVGTVLGGNYLLAAHLVNLIAGAGLVLVLRVLFSRLASNRTADRAVVLYCFFPGTAVLSFAYAEPVALLAAAACLLMLLESRWVWAGLAAAVADATRPNLLLVGGACAVCAAAAIVRRREWSALLAPVLAPLGALGYFAYLGVHTGDFLAWQHNEQRFWGQNIDFSEGIFADWWHALEAHSYWGSTNQLIAFAGVVFTVVTVVLLIRMRPPLAVAAYTVVVLAPCLLYSTVGFRPRFLDAAFPLFLALAAALSWRWYRLLTVGSAGALMCLTVLYLGGTAIP